ncbi:beta-lactamase-like protein [Xylogone sp. PMI_703]|nr:beta-lactamase-like protein [Xylogone sp. PMI_703]
MLPPEWYFYAGGGQKHFRMYDWVFYIHHPKLNRHIFWDVGLDRNQDIAPPVISKLFFEGFKPLGPRRSLPEQLDNLGVSASSVDAVIFSHAHYDHCHPIRSIFPNAYGYFGPGTKKHCSPGHFKDPRLPWDGAFFDPEQATEQWSELEGPWVPFGPFDKAMDFFGDGSVWLVQAPGHMPGNLFAAVHTGDGQWVILGGDCCHSRSILNGEVEIAEFDYPGRGRMSAHDDLGEAKQTIKKLRDLEIENYNVHIALCHDDKWMREGKDAVLMAMLDADMKSFVAEKLPSDEVP